MTGAKAGSKGRRPAVSMPPEIRPHLASDLRRDLTGLGQGQAMQPETLICSNPSCKTSPITVRSSALLDKFCIACGYRLVEPGRRAISPSRSPREGEGTPSTPSPYPLGSLSVVSEWSDGSSFLAPVLPVEKWSPGQLVLGEYFLQRILGEGGFGVVYLARSRLTGRTYALKAAKLGGPAAQRNLLTELQTWVDLPEHPNIVACHYFLSIDDGVAIFAEYLDGGSLVDWVKARKARSPRQILDIAIQTARGLHASHERGVVHQDVKPSNVLMARDDVAKIGDYGLACAQAVGGPPIASAAGGPLVTNRGGTRAYLSPEQFEGKRVGHRTDQWSWALMIFDLFQGEGEPAGRLGPAASILLDEYLMRAGADRRLARIPASIVGLLRRCFQAEPGDRWGSMGEIAAELARIYEATRCRRYFRPSPRLVLDREGRAARRARRRFDAIVSREGKKVDAPGPRLPDPSDPGAPRAPEASPSNRADLIAHIKAHQEERADLGSRIAGGDASLRGELAEVCLDQARMHWALDDAPGIDPLLDQAIPLYEVSIEGDGPRRARLAGAYRWKASREMDRGHYEVAMEFYDQSVGLYGELAIGEAGYGRILCEVAREKAVLLAFLHRPGDSIAAYDLAIRSLEPLARQEDLRGLAHALGTAGAAGANPPPPPSRDRQLLATTLMDRAWPMAELDDCDAAGGQVRRSIAMAQMLVDRQLAPPLFLADLLMSGASVLEKYKGKGPAAALADRAIDIYDQQGDFEAGREDMLAAAHRLKADLLSARGHHREAAASLAKAIRIYEELTDDDVHLPMTKREHLWSSLAGCYVERAKAVRPLGSNRLARSLLDRAIPILERLVEHLDRDKPERDLAKARMLRASTLYASGHRLLALAEADRILADLKKGGAAGGRVELGQFLMWMSLDVEELC